jgi:hypothetical protein
MMNKENEYNRPNQPHKSSSGKRFKVPDPARQFMSGNISSNSNSTLNSSKNLPNSSSTPVANLASNIITSIQSNTFETNLETAAGGLLDLQVNIQREPTGTQANQDENAGFENELSDLGIEHNEDEVAMFDENITAGLRLFCSTTQRITRDRAKISASLKTLDIPSKMNM